MMTYGNLNKRQAGILMPVASLPNRHGIGSFGKETCDFIDCCVEMGFKIWQMLPLNPLGFGSSPYQTFSSFAIDEVYIDIDTLIEEKLLDACDDFLFDAEYVDYEAIRNYKRLYSETAFLRFKKDIEYREFVNTAYWLEDYSEFMCLKYENDGVSWLEWNITDYLSEWDERKEYIKFVQFMLYKQWMKVKQYANTKGISIIGDIPFYVGLDSADVYYHRESFLLDKDNQPISVAGVPPDYFSKEGQLWGNPIYDFEYLKKNRYKLWSERFGWNKNLFDFIRIDHFRAFDTYWQIPIGEVTAKNGEWVEGPSYDLFDSIFKDHKDLVLIAEDLGDLRKEVLELRDYYQLLGMRIIQYSFGRNEEREHFKIPEYCIAYTGTHDNSPVKGWYKNLDKKEKRRMRHILSSFNYSKAKTVSEKVLYHAFACEARVAIVQVQDILNLGEESRINLPGTLGFPNWCWRLSSLQPLEKKIKKIKRWLIETKRK